MLSATFFGVRGSSPCADASLVRYGGNTSCVVLEADDSDPVVLDLGTGLRQYGNRLHGRAFQGAALVSHLHFDHVQGLPFFAPMLNADTNLVVYGPRGGVERGDDVPLAKAFDSFVRPPFFPVTLDEFAGRVEFVEIVDATFEVDGARVTSRSIPHVGLTLGFRVEMGGASVAYLSDHQQPYDGGLEVSDAALELASGVDLLIHDSQYLPDEFARKWNWGHCTSEFAVEVARLAGVRSLALFHHDPMRSDNALDALVVCHRRQAEHCGFDLFAAAEGETVPVGAC